MRWEPFVVVDEFAGVPVLILNWNGWDDTFQCIESIRSAGDGCEIWVIDNGSSKNRQTELAESFPDVKFLGLDQNYGWAGGYNRAIEHMRNLGVKFAYLLNNDTIVQKGFLKHAVSVAENQAIAAVGSKIIESDTGFVKFDGQYREGQNLPHEPEVEVVGCPQVNGAGLLISLDAFGVIGPFDERFFCYCEESEWCHRATAKNNYQVVVARGSVIEHACEGSDVSQNALYYRTRNTFLLHEIKDGHRRNAYKKFENRLWRFRKNHDHASVRTLLCAFQDAESGKFGQRHSLTPNLSTLLRHQCWKTKKLVRSSVRSVLTRVEGE